MWRKSCSSLLSSAFVVALGVSVAGPIWGNSFSQNTGYDIGTHWGPRGSFQQSGTDQGTAGAKPADQKEEKKEKKATKTKKAKKETKDEMKKDKKKDRRRYEEGRYEERMI